MCRFIFFLVIFVASGLRSQNLAWVRTFATSSTSPGESVGYAVTHDRFGNVYSTGWFNGITDFDPGPGTYPLSSGWPNNSYVSKLDAAGNFVWAKALTGDGCIGWSISIDRSQNVYITGTFGGTCDFDPGPASYTVTASAPLLNNAFVLKLDSAGNFIWVKTIGGNASGNGEFGVSVMPDNFGNLYLCGFFTGTADFDPGPSTYTVTSNGDYDAYVEKLDTSGNFIWAKCFGGVRGEGVGSLTCDQSGNVYVCGDYGDTVDFDPGPSTYTLYGTAANAYILKLDASGNFVWVKDFEMTPANPLNSGDCIALDIALDGSGNIYTTGRFSDLVDFDPGAGTYTLSSAAQYTNVSPPVSAFISKLDAAGNFLWARQMRTTNLIGTCFGNSIAVDNLGNNYVAGIYSDTVDFDPGAATYTLASLSTILSASQYISKLDAGGNFIWVKSIANCNYNPDLSIDSANNIYLTSQFIYRGIYDTLFANYGFGSSSTIDGYVLKLDCAPGAPGAINGNSVICTGVLITYSIAAIAEATGYTWTAPAGWVINSGQTTNIITVTPGILSGSIAVNAFNSCGNGAIRTRTVGVISSTPAAPVSLSWLSATCAGKSASYSINPVPGASAYSWTAPPGATVNTALSGTLAGVIFGNLSGNLTVIASNLCGPGPATSLSIAVNPLPSISVTAFPSSTVCDSTSIILNGSGASTYTWSGGITNGQSFIAAANVIYSLSGTDANGCQASNTVQILVYPLPLISAFATSSLPCFGSTLALNATGANSYTWSNGVIQGQAFVAQASNSYTVVGTDTNGCMSSADVPVNVYPLPVITVSFNPSFAVCEGESLALTASGASIYNWSNGVIQGQAFVAQASNSYTVVGTDTNGCMSSTYVSVNVYPLPVISVSSNPSFVVCEGESLSLTASGASTYNWSNGIVNGQFFTPSASVIYTLSAADSHGCAVDTLIAVTVNPLPVIISPTDQQVLAGSNAQFTVSSSQNALYQWEIDSGQGFVNLGNNPPYSGAATATLVIGNVTLAENSYRLRCIVTGVSCSDTSTVAILTVYDETSILSLKNSNPFSVRPNPFADIITIEVSKSSAYSGFTITDLTGREIVSGILDTEQTRINLSSFAKGMYLLKLPLVTNNSIKIIKE